MIELQPDTLTLVKIGDIATIVLPEHTDSAQTWHLFYAEKQYRDCLLKTSEQVQRLRGKSDHDVNHIFEFQTLKPGFSVLIFELYEDWGGRELTREQRSYRVMVLDPQPEPVPTAPTARVATPETPDFQQNAKRIDWEDMDNHRFSTLHANAHLLQQTQPFIHFLNIGEAFVVDIEHKMDDAQWVPMLLEEGIKMTDNHIFRYDAVSLVIPGIQTVRFQAVKPGKYTLSFRLVLPDGKVLTQDKYTYHLNIQ